MKCVLTYIRNFNYSVFVCRQIFDGCVVIFVLVIIIRTFKNINIYVFYWQTAFSVKYIDYEIFVFFCGDKTKSADLERMKSWQIIYFI